MKSIKLALIAFTFSLLAACATTDGPQVYDFDETRQSVDVLLMPLDVEVRFAKVGGNDLRADWTETATQNFQGSITEHLKSTGEKVVNYETYDGRMVDLEQLILLQQQVAEAITSHVVLVNPTSFKGRLPHKAGENLLTYSLGSDAKRLKEVTDADYAAFLTNRTVIESSGSFWAKVAIGAVTGYTPALSSFKGTYVTLVDLETGEVVWLNAHTGTTLLSSDARNRDNTDAVVAKIMEKGPFSDGPSEK